MNMEAVLAPMGPEEDDQICGIPGCGRPAAYHLVKFADHASEQEKFFCREHGIDYSTRGHLAISESS
jgi:hypothetical protein